MKTHVFLFTIFLFAVLISGAQITDYDGNVYDTVAIGTQTWLVQNLKSAHYNDGTVIEEVSNDAQWSAMSSGACCWYDNNQALYSDYGKLYNWFAVNTAKLCPAGWKVPSNEEWNTLADFLGGASVAGGKLKEIGTTHWLPPNTGATNESGFTALPGGIRGIGAAFYDIQKFGILWSSTSISTDYATVRFLGYMDASVISNNYPKTDGFSVRCLKSAGVSVTEPMFDQHLKLYPNPASDLIYFQSALPEESVITIMDALGRQLMSQKYDLTPIDVSLLEPGVYILIVTHSESAIVAKFMKE